MTLILLKRNYYIIIHWKTFSLRTEVELFNSPSKYYYITKLHYLAQFKCYLKKSKELIVKKYKMKKFNLNKKIVHVKILGTANLLTVHIANCNKNHADFYRIMK